MKCIKKITAIVLSLLMILSVAPVAFAEGEETTPEAAWYTSYGMKTGEGTLVDAATGVVKGGRIVVLRDVTLNEQITIGTKATITSDSAIHTIKRSDSYAGQLFAINGADVIFTNITIDGNSENYPGKTDRIMNVYNGSVTLDKGATLTNNYAPNNHGGAITAGKEGDTVNPVSTINIKDGAVISNCTGSNGGAILLFTNAVCNMSGGEIKNCKGVNDAGAIDSYYATFNMTGGTITGCECCLDPSYRTGWASAVSIEVGSTVNITGGTISGNKNPSGKGSIYIEKGANVTVGGSAYIYDSTKDGTTGSNIFMENDAEITISPAFTDGARIGITQETASATPSISNIKYDSSIDITGFIYDDVQNLSYYVSNGNVTLLECITVTFDPGNGTCSVKSKKYPSDVDFGELPTPDDRDGFEFDGWYTANDVLITADSPVSFSEDITLYAKWTNLNTLDQSIWARIGRFFEQIGNLMKIAFNFLSNLFNGTGDKNLDDIKP